MKVVILAGGNGTYLSDGSGTLPTPLVTIGGKPILWHIMKLYSSHGLNDFVICCGYRGEMVKDYFADYVLHNADVTFDLAGNRMLLHQQVAEPWHVTLVDTGDDEMTGNRLRLVRHRLDGTFCLAYGDAISDVNISELIDFHRRSGGLATVTAVDHPSRFGELGVAKGETWIRASRQWPVRRQRLISGGFFVLEPAVLNYIVHEASVLEREPLQRLAADGALLAYHHRGFWQKVATLEDKHLLERLWASGHAPWCVWGAAQPKASVPFQSEITYAH